METLDDLGLEVYRQYDEVRQCAGSRARRASVNSNSQSNEGDVCLIVRSDVMYNVETACLRVFFLGGGKLLGMRFLLGCHGKLYKGLLIILVDVVDVLVNVCTYFFYKFSSNVCLGGFAGSEPSLSIACCAGPDPTTRSRNSSAMAEFYPNV